MPPEGHMMSCSGERQERTLGMVTLHVRRMWRRRRPSSMGCNFAVRSIRSRSTTCMGAEMRVRSTC
eukprot:14462748-Alexandrium_andersonii.AAC.1